MIRRAAPLALALLLAPVAARAGNDEAVLFGSEATVTAGAVTATTSEGSALWYNPAGIAAVPNSRLDVSGSAFMLRFHHVANFAQVQGGAPVGASITEFVSIPAAATYVRRLGARVQFAAGVFVPEHSDYTLRQSLTGPDRSRWVITDSSIEDDTHVGAGLGIDVHPRVRIGVSLFAAYRSGSGSQQFLGGVAGMGAVDTFSTNSSLYSHRAIALELGFGVQWAPTDTLRLGVSLRSPGVQIYEGWSNTEIVTRAQTTNGPAANFDPVVSEGSGFGAAVVTPFKVRFGAAWVTGRASFSVDGDVATALTSEHDNTRDLNWNVRVGARWRLREQFLLGAGLFTDRSPYRAPEVVGPRGLDFYGATVGVEFGNTHTVVNGPAPALTFATTLGLRYAYGLGELDTVLIDLQNNPSVASGAITVHEVGVNLGSTLRF
jgi:hypothetical protein